jgi:uncharacterized protein (DUF1330 family)
MAAYVIAHIDVTDPAHYEEYKKMVPASMAKYGGRFLVRGPKPEVLEGDWDPKRLVIVEFPSAARAREWFESAEYAPARDRRRAASRGTLVLLDGI